MNNPILNRLNDDIQAFFESGKQIKHCAFGESADKGDNFSKRERFMINGENWQTRQEASRLELIAKIATNQQGAGK